MQTMTGFSASSEALELRWVSAPAREQACAYLPLPELGDAALFKEAALEALPPMFWLAVVQLRIAWSSKVKTLKICQNGIALGPVPGSPFLYTHMLLCIAGLKKGIEATDALSDFFKRPVERLGGHMTGIQINDPAPGKVTLIAYVPSLRSEKDAPVEDSGSGRAVGDLAVR